MVDKNKTVQPVVETSALKIYLRLLSYLKSYR